MKNKQPPHPQSPPQSNTSLEEATNSLKKVFPEATVNEFIKQIAPWQKNYISDFTQLTQEGNNLKLQVAILRKTMLIHMELTETRIITTTIQLHHIINTQLGAQDTTMTLSISTSAKNNANLNYSATTSKQREALRNFALDLQKTLNTLTND